jgi:hypothetical protein
MWADAMKRRLLADFSPQQVLSYAATNGHVTTAVLAGVEKDGNAWIQGVTIKFSNTDGLYNEGFKLISNDPPTAYYVLGKKETVELGLEFEQGSSNRAVTEQMTWNQKNLAGASLEDASGVQWLHVKPNCNQSYW